MKEKIQIDVVSDVACPWCYVGKKNLEKAMEAADDFEFQVNWHPFMLDPTIPKEGRNFEDHFTNKFGSMDNFKNISSRVEMAGSAAGIHFRFDLIPNIPNTLSMHQLLQVAGHEGFAGELKETLLKAYFEQGLDLTDQSTFFDIMSQFGWTNEKTSQVLNDEPLQQHVLAEIDHIQKLGVSSVPFFIINNKYAVSGAQPVDTFVQMIKEAGKELILSTEGESCGVDGC